MTGNETSAIASLKVTTSSQVAYSASCGNGGYAASFTVLGTPPGGHARASSRPTSAAVATPQKSGYNFTLVAGAGSAAGPNDCNGTATITAYYATARPDDVRHDGHAFVRGERGQHDLAARLGDGSDRAFAAQRADARSSKRLRRFDLTVPAGDLPRTRHREASNGLGDRAPPRARPVVQPSVG